MFVMIPILASLEMTHLKSMRLYWIMVITQFMFTELTIMVHAPQV